MRLQDAFLISPDSHVSLFASPEPRAFLHLKFEISITLSPLYSFLWHSHVLSPKPLQERDFSLRGCWSTKSEELQKIFHLGFPVKLTISELFLCLKSWSKFWIHFVQFDPYPLQGRPHHKEYFTAKYPLLTFFLC